MARTRILMSVVPNFQLVLSNARRYGGLCGNKANTKRAIRSVSSRYSAMNRCILRNEESTLTLESKPAASFSKQTVWTLHKAQINKPKNFIRAKFILSPNICDNVENKMVFLFSALMSMYLWVIASHFTHNILNIRALSNIFKCKLLPSY